MGTCSSKEYISLNIPEDIKIIEKIIFLDEKDNKIPVLFKEQRLCIHTLKISDVKSLHFFEHNNELNNATSEWIVKNFRYLKSIYIFGEKTTRCPFEFSKLKHLKTLVVRSNHIFQGFPAGYFPNVNYFSIGNLVLNKDSLGN